LVVDYHEADLGHNLALSKPTKQSSTDKNYDSWRAVNGRTQINVKDNTLTRRTLGSWWQVDMAAIYEVHVVVITSKLTLFHIVDQIGSLV